MHQDHHDIDPDDPDQDFEDDDEPICSACNGSGEGMYDGSTCYKCKGYGHERPERSDEP
jgi:DnaJ-class molecular chaperone